MSWDCWSRRGWRSAGRPSPGLRAFFREVLLFSVALPALPAPYAHFCCILRAPQHCIVEVQWLLVGTASLQISVCAVKASRNKNTKTKLSLKPPVPGTSTVPCSAPDTSESGQFHSVPLWYMRGNQDFCPDLIVMDVFILENISLLVDCTVFSLGFCFSKEHTLETHTPASHS